MRKKKNTDDLVALDFSLDLMIYSVFTLLITTATLWRATWNAMRREPRGLRRTVKMLVVKGVIHVVRELAIIMVNTYFKYFLWSWWLSFKVTEG